MSLQSQPLPSLQSLPEKIEASPRRSFWQRRVRDPLVAQLTQGVTPDKIALTLALGSICALFPFLGFTTLMCFLVAWMLRLNQPIIQILNQLFWPIHLPMMVVYVHFGAWLHGAELVEFDHHEIAYLFTHSQREFWTRFGTMGRYAFVAWLISAPVIFVGVYYPLRPVLRKLASLRRAELSKR